MSVSPRRRANDMNIRTCSTKNRLKAGSVSCAAHGGGRRPCALASQTPPPAARQALACGLCRPLVPSTCAAACGVTSLSRALQCRMGDAEAP